MPKRLTGSLIQNCQPLKSRFTKPAASGPLQEVEQAPQREDNSEALKIQFKRALKEDEIFITGQKRTL
jgi:hypothetical protein